MEAVLFCGIQATGKTTFFKQRFFKTHIRISLDQLNTRNKEQRFLETCVATQQPFVVDNTNPTKKSGLATLLWQKKTSLKSLGTIFNRKYRKPWYGMISGLEKKKYRMSELKEQQRSWSFPVLKKDLMNCIM